MMNRRKFAMLFAGSIGASGLTWGQTSKAKRNTVFYSSVGGDLTLYEMNIEAASLAKRNTVTVPANIQYAWPHPSAPYLYVVSSVGGPGVASNENFAHAFRIDPATGALTLHGQPQSLPSRPIHTSVDRSIEHILELLGLVLESLSDEARLVGEHHRPIGPPDLHPDDGGLQET